MKSIAQNEVSSPVAARLRQFSEVPASNVINFSESVLPPLTKRNHTLNHQFNEDLIKGTLKQNEDRYKQFNKRHHSIKPGRLAELTVKPSLVIKERNKILIQKN